MKIRIFGIALALGLMVIGAHAQIFVPDVLDSNFESPNLSGGFQYGPTGTSWTFTLGAGIAAQGSTFAIIGGTGQVGFIQGASSISQSIYLEAGYYDVTFDAEGRGSPGYNTFMANPLTVSLGSDQLYDSTPAQNSFTGQTTTETGLLSAGYYTLSFNGLGGDGDRTTFVDNVDVIQVEGVPEPSQVMLLLVGLAVLLRHRRLGLKRARI